MIRLLLIICLALLTACTNMDKENIIYESDKFKIYKNKVVQGENIAEVISPTHLKSNYKSPASSSYSRLIKFKFSINEKDNELPPGTDHWVIIDSENVSPVIKFGEAPPPLPDQPGTFLPTNYEYTFRVDVSEVLTSFDKKGYYEAFDGNKIAKTDFKGFYLAGDAEPLTWDFVNLENQGLKLEATDNPNIYSLTVKLNPYKEEDYADKEWKLSENVTHKPQYQSDQAIVDALYNLSLEEALINIEPDSTLRTGAKWGGVWTRDVSYSILLAFAYHEPEVAKISLRKKVKRNRIIQDTGSGGAWPVSSDRTTWCLAAWEIYLVTGDEDWLDEIYPVIKNTLEDDYLTIYDKSTGMYSGESSFLDWREQTYPKWMDNKDIYSSLNLGTSVVHYQAHRILANIAKLKGDPFQIYLERADKIKSGINEYLWLEDEGYYAQFLYGRDEKIVSTRFEALGEALAILFNVANEDQAVKIISDAPVTEFGTTCIYPQIPGIPPYHNNGIWPFVQSYWNWAAAKTGNAAVLNHGLASVYRAAALFLTNYENMVAKTGDFLGTEINSHRMLWSMAGNLAMVHRVFMGMEFTEDGLHFNPVVPKAYAGSKTLSNFKYRNTDITVKVNGYGNKINSVSINGKPADEALIPSDASGEYTLIIELDNRPMPFGQINLVENHFSPTTIQSTIEGSTLKWKAEDNAVKYRVYKNGVVVDETSDLTFDIMPDEFANYMVSGIDANGYEGFASQPIIMAKKIQRLEIEDFAKASDLPYSNYSGNGFIEINVNQNRNIEIPVVIDEPGEYLIDIRYSNGSGPWNTDNKCAIRSLTINGVYKGVIVLPQRGKDEWSDWGNSNIINTEFKKGMNTIKIHFEDWNNNMNIDVNTAMIDYIRLRKKN